MKILEMLYIDHYNKDDLIVTVHFDKMVRTVKRAAYYIYIYNKVNPLEVAKSNFTVEMLSKHFELKYSYKAEYFMTITLMGDRIIKIVLTKK